MLKRLTLLALIAAGVAVGQITQSPVAGGGGGGDASEATLATRLGEATYTGRTGEVQASPTAYTVLGRLKAIEDALASLLTELQAKTEPANSQTVTGTVTANAGTGNFTVTQGTGTNLHMVCDSGCTPGGSTADNSALTFGTTALNPAGFVLDDTSPNTVTENNVAAPRMSSNRVPYSIIRDADLNERGAKVNANGELLVNPGTVAVTGTFYQATQPVSAASLPLPTGASTEATLSTLNGKVTAVDTGNVTVSSSALPTGAATAAKQPALGTAGTASADVLTVQGIASMTALKVDGSAVTQPVSGTVTATGPLTDTQLRATPVPVSGTFYQATQPVSASSLPLPTGASTLAEQQTQTTALQLLDDAVATTASAITAKGLAASGTDGTNARVLKTDTSGELQVDVLTLPTATVTQSTSSNLKAQVDPLTAASWGVGATAATAPANAGYVGVIGKNTQPTAVTDGQMAGMVASLDGVQFVRMGGPVLWTCSLNAIAASLTQCQAAPGAGLSLYVTGLYVQTTTTTSGTYALQTGTGTNCGTGTTAFFPSSSTSNRFNAPITSNAMAAIQFPVPLKVAANSALCLIGVATNTISAQIVGFTAP